MPEIFIEVRPKGAGAGDLSARVSKKEELLDRIDELGSSLQEISNRLSKKLDELATKKEPGWKLREVSLQFSLDLEAEAGVIIARTKTSAGFEATFSWKNET